MIPGNRGKYFLLGIRVLQECVDVCILAAAAEDPAKKIVKINTGLLIFMIVVF
jgi:hypothetical protein